MNHDEATRYFDALGKDIFVARPLTNDLITRGRAAERRATRKIVAVAAASVVLVLGGSAAIQEVVAGEETDMPSGSLSGDVPTVPDGMRLVGTGRVVVAVPDSWGTQVLDECERPAAPTVWFPQARQDAQTIECAGTESPPVPMVSILRLDSEDGRDLAKYATAETTLNGVAVRVQPGACRTEEPPIGKCLGVDVAVVPDHGAVFATDPSTDSIGVLASLQLLPEGYTTVPFVDPGTLASDAEDAVEEAGLDADLDVPDFNLAVEGTDPAAGAVVSVGSPVTILMPPVSGYAPNLSMTVTPSAARAGDVVALHFPNETMRGLGFILFAPVCDDCTSPGSTFDPTAYYLSSDALEGTDPQWSDAPLPLRSIGIRGAGPDHVVIPEVAVPGRYMLCTDGAEQEICTTVTVNR